MVTIETQRGTTLDHSGPLSRRGREGAGTAPCTNRTDIPEIGRLVPTNPCALVQSPAPNLQHYFGTLIFIAHRERKGSV